MALLYRSAIRNLPDGYTFRGATLHDAPEVAWLFHQRFMISDTDASSHAEKIRKEWQSFNFNPAMDVRLVLDQREHLIGYIEVWTALLPAMQPWLWGCVHPDFEGRGIGTALLSWAEARVRLALYILPAGQRVASRFGAPRALTTAQALCSALGWRRSEPAQPLKKTTGALQLLDESAYDIYEKELAAVD